MTSNSSINNGVDDFILPRSVKFISESLDNEDGEDGIDLLNNEDIDGGESSDNSANLKGTTQQTRLSTIGSIVNTMMGTTIVALPYGLAESGLGAGLLIIAILGAVSCFTCLVVVESTPRVIEFSKTVRRFLGVHTQLLAWGISVAIILGAAIIYHILMQETLFALVTTIMSSFGANSALSVWRREYAALVPFLLLYPVSCLKDLSLLIRFNSFGFLFLTYVIVFIASHGITVLFNASSAPLEYVSTLGATDPLYGADGSLRLVLLSTPNFASLGGMMMLSFFLHNCIQPIVKNANPATRRTDVIVAYCIAGSLYASVGVLGYFGFADAHSKSDCAASPPLSLVSPCILKSNFLAMFAQDLSNKAAAYTLSARAALLLQLFTVFPLLLLIIRTQVFSLVYGSEWPSSYKVYIINLLVCAVSFTFAAQDLSVSEVMRFVGAGGGFVIVFAVPAAMDYMWHKREGKISFSRVALDVFVVLVGLSFLVMQFI
jgi:sodium-coupled neutral amino acid transporter 9